MAKNKKKDEEDKKKDKKEKIKKKDKKTGEKKQKENKTEDKKKKETDKKDISKKDKNKKDNSKTIEKKADKKADKKKLDKSKKEKTKEKGKEKTENQEKVAPKSKLEEAEEKGEMSQPQEAVAEISQRYFVMKSPIGNIRIEEEEGSIRELIFVEEEEIQAETELFIEVEKQLKEYFSGERFKFNLPLNFEGTEFQKSVWIELQNIPYGETRTFSEVSFALGKPNAASAVSGANNRNPILILIPSHRILTKDGSLSSYTAGLERKSFLLDLEKKTQKAGE